MKILYVTTVGVTMSFFKSLIDDLIKEGNVIDIACNETGFPVADCYREWGCKIYPLSCERSPMAKGNVCAIREIKRLVEDNKYDIVHCHTPIAAACTRIACRSLPKSGTKVIYTAHGFHFFEGAPLKNWILYYPIEKICSRWTDVLITINKEDYQRAQKKMKAEKIVYIPGVGIDLKKFAPNILTREERQKLRADLGIGSDERMLLSVGELNENKNHQVVIKAISRLRDNNIHYVIVGKGELSRKLKKIAYDLGVTERVHFLGYREDVSTIYEMADIYILPSIREGLNVSLMEAMASGLPCICGDIRGNVDLINRTECLFNPLDENSVVQTLERTVSKSMVAYSEKNKEVVRKCDVGEICVAMKKIYEKV